MRGRESAKVSRREKQGASLLQRVCRILEFSAAYFCFLGKTISARNLLSSVQDPTHHVALLPFCGHFIFSVQHQEVMFVRGKRASLIHHRIFRGLCSLSLGLTASSSSWKAPAGLSLCNVASAIRKKTWPEPTVQRVNRKLTA